MASYACLAFDAGARIIGGCCGTTAAHLSAMKAALTAHVRGARPGVAAIESLLGPITAGARAQIDPEAARLAAIAAAEAGEGPTVRAASPRARRARQ